MYYGLSGADAALKTLCKLIILKCWNVEVQFWKTNSYTPFEQPHPFNSSQRWLSIEMRQITVQAGKQPLPAAVNHGYSIKS